MADTAKRLYGPAQPGTSNGTLYTASSGGCIIRSIIITNTTATIATISISINGTAATASNCLYYEVSIPAYSVNDYSGFIHLASGDTIQGLQGTTSAITVTISGIEL